MAEDDIRTDSEDSTLISEDELDRITGGAIFFSNPYYEVVDDKGNVVDKFDYLAKGKERAIARARELGFSDEELTWGALNRLRNQNK